MLFSLLNKNNNSKLRIHRLCKNEKIFSAKGYKGNGEQIIETNLGESNVALIAPHSVNYYEESNHSADKFTGAISRLIAEKSGCYGISIGKAYDKNSREEVIEEIRKKVLYSRTKIKVVIDLQVTDILDEEVIQLEDTDLTFGTECCFVKKTIKYAFEYYYKNKKNNIVKIRNTPDPSVLKTAFLNTEISYVYVGVNRNMCSKENTGLLSLYDSLLMAISMLTHLDWNASQKEVFRLWQSSTHKPQDKIEITVASDSPAPFKIGSLLNIYSYGRKTENARLHRANKKSIIELENNKNQNNGKEEYIFLTNRLIEILFNREWIEEREDDAGLKGAPIVVYEMPKDIYPIGLPKANQIDGVYFSSELYKSKKNESSNYDFVIFNRFTDSRLFIEFDQVNYEDFGRVKDASGKSTKKVMIPRYYKRLLGYLDYPLKMIRSEEYENIIRNLNNEPEKVEAFKDCYEKMGGEAYYKLKEKNEQRISDVIENQDILKYKKKRDIIIDVQNSLNLFNNVEILRVRKEPLEKAGIMHRIFLRLYRIFILLLNRSIGKSNYLLKTKWTNETDDRNNIARLSPNMMSLLGVDENDKLIIKFGRKQEKLRALANDNLTDFEIGIPAPARKRLGMNSVNDIVIVHRDMIHILLRHSEHQTIAILGTVLAVFQVVRNIWIGIILCFIFVPLILYFSLNEERVKVK